MQNSKRNIIGIVVLVALSAVVAVALYVLRPTAAPSGEIVAIPIEFSTEAVSSTESTAEEMEETSTSVSGPRIFEIQQSASQASFTIEEILRGNETTVIGVTDQVAGQILLDLENPGSTQVGIIQVNARTLATDVENRNRAIRNQILDVDEFEFISFEPGSIEGLPELIEIGQSYAVIIRGDLSIRHITNEATFEASITIDSADQISGSASAIIQRADYELTIPQVPNVAGVEESVIVALRFIALAQ